MFTNPTLALIEDNIQTKFEPLFKHLRKKWSPKIREAHRQNIGVKSIAENFKFNFKLIFEADELKFRKIFEEKYPDLVLEKLNTFLKFMEIGERIDEDEYFEGAYQKTLKNELSYVNDYIDRHDIDEIITEILDNSGYVTCKDVMGAYFPEERRVELYYIPIVTLSKLLNVEIETLFMIILAHELAHGYHHLGADIDNFTWDNFNKANDKLVEPLAQFYTWSFLKEQDKEFQETFVKLLNYQRLVYSYHKTWIDRFDKEMIRLALLTSRRNEMPNLEEFENTLDQQKKLWKYKDTKHNLF